MLFFKERLISSDEVLGVLTACVLPIFIWSIIQMMWEIPGWILRMGAWQLIGVIAYVQAFALVESLAIAALLIIIGIILPRRFFRDNIISISAMFIFVTALWAVLAHYSEDTIRLWRLKEFLPWIAIYIFTIGIGYYLIQRSEQLAKKIRLLVDRGSVLAFFYVFIGILSVVIVIIRNI
jgi:hypothetical protein